MSDTIMRRPFGSLRALILVPACFAMAACSSSSDNTEDTDDTESTTTAAGSVDITLFPEGALASDPEIIDCTMSDGTETSCYKIITTGTPQGHDVGPFCPPTTTSTAEEGGVWLDGSGEVYDLDGDFFLNLPNLYSQTYTGSDWIFYDTDGKISITDTQESCEAAAQPDVDAAYQNHCVECEMDYIDGGLSVEYVIPVTPIVADVTGSIGSAVGVSLSGAELSAPAPVQDILSNYTIAAFDDCGGHINVHQGYHYHAANGCSVDEGEQSDDHAALLGYAMDGYGVYSQLASDLDSAVTATEELDECRGTTDDVRGYHYHVATAGENTFIGCYHGKTIAQETPGGDGPTDGSPPGGGPPAQ